MKSKHRLNIFLWIFFSISLAINLFIIINAFIPGDESAQTSFWVADLLASLINSIRANTITDTNLVEFTYLVRKLIGHFSLFLVDGIFVSLTAYCYSLLKAKCPWWWNVISTLEVGLSIAVLSEFIQLFIPGRVGSVTDVLIDMCGYLIAMLIILIIFLIKHQKVIKQKTAS